MDDRDEWQERVREICANGTTWLWLYITYYNDRTANKKSFCIKSAEGCYGQAGIKPMNRRIIYTISADTHGYCCRKWTQRQILDEADCISHSTRTLGKGMNPIILPPAMGK